MVDVTTDANAFNWRTVGVKRERAHDALIQRLTLDNKSLFTYLKDLMVFGAMVGHSLCRRKPVSGDTVEIILDTYASDQKDGFIYLLALVEKKDGAVLKDENLKETVRVFEEYCNAGLYEITDWLDKNPGDPIGIDTLLFKILNEISKNDDEAGASPIDIEVTI